MTAAHYGTDVASGNDRSMPTDFAMRRSVAGSVGHRGREASVGSRKSQSLTTPSMIISVPAMDGSILRALTWLSSLSEDGKTKGWAGSCPVRWRSSTYPRSVKKLTSCVRCSTIPSPSSATQVASIMPTLPRPTPLRRSKGIAEKGDACEIWMFIGDITFPQYTLRFFWAGSNIF